MLNHHSSCPIKRMPFPLRNCITQLFMSYEKKLGNERVEEGNSCPVGNHNVMQRSEEK